MERILSTAVGALIVTATLGVSAQQPLRTLAPRPAARAVGPAGNPASPTDPVVPRSLPGSRQTPFARIQGNALTSTNGALPDVVVRLRDARVGRIVDSQLTDKAGLFEFGLFEPGMYIVELVGEDSSILAASQMLSVDAGNVVSAVVKMPVRVPPLLGSFSQPALAGIVTSAAAASGVLAARATTPVTPQ